MTLHAEDRDESVAPGDDFYRYANGGWIDAHEIPPGFGAWGSFEEVITRNEHVLLELVQRAADSPADDVQRMLGNHFAAGMDTDAIEALGAGPLRPWLDVVDGLGTHQDLLDAMPRLHGDGISLLWGVGVTVDHDDSTRHLLWVVPGGLGLPDRESYLGQSEAAVALREAYVAHIAAQLRNIGADDVAAHAADVLEFETRLAERHLKAEERRDLSRTLNRRTLVELHDLAPALDLPAYLVAIGAHLSETVNVQQPDYLAALHDIVLATPLDVLKAYVTFHVVHQAADALFAAVEDEDFDFYGRRIQGKQEPKERWKRILAALGTDMGEALGQLFVAETFPPSAKDEALAMVGEILAEMRTSLQTRTWMSDETRARALTKLDAIRVKIGYPDVWRDWSGLHVTRTTYLANRVAAGRFELQRQLSLIDQPVDVTEWEMPPHAVNAYYHPIRNEIVFPAGILQPPFFDADADDAVNFGGIGTVVAHEVSHGFDDQGRQFDADGAFRDWWTEQDQAHFTSLAERLVAQFDEYVVLDEVHVNGRLTLGENIADLGGLALAGRAHARVSAGQPDIDGLSPAQRFFLANATIWRARVSEELARTHAQVDPHSPRFIRVRGPLSNSDAFQQAFGLSDDAAMMRPREDRIEIW